MTALQVCFPPTLDVLWAEEQRTKPRVAGSKGWISTESPRGRWPQESPGMGYDTHKACSLTQAQVHSPSMAAATILSGWAPKFSLWPVKPLKWLNSAKFSHSALSLKVR